jgi:3-dehydroquinate synthase class II
MGMLSESEFAVHFVQCEVVKVQAVGVGDRVCIDTCSLLG